MKVGDLIIHRRPAPWGRKLVGFGIVIEFQKESCYTDTDWSLILWGDGRMTWEDVECSMEDGAFEVVSESG